MRFSLGLSLSAAVLLATAQVALAAPAPPGAPAVRRDARESVPAALIGAWKVDLARSTYAGTPPRNHLRFFEYTADGKIMVTFMTLSATGAQSTGHWSVQVDGSPGIEYTRSYGSTPYNIVTLTKADEYTFNLTVARHGVMNQTGTFKLSPDGETLTYTYATGAGNTTVIYSRWDMAG
jgi:hypothetical protein